MNLLWGIAGVFLCFALIKYRRYIIDFTGPWGWAERFLGRGSSPLALVLLSIFFFFLSISLMTGHLDTFIRGTFGKIFGIS